MAAFIGSLLKHVDNEHGFELVGWRIWQAMGRYRGEKFANLIGARYPNLGQSGRIIAYIEKAALNDHRGKGESKKQRIIAKGKAAAGFNEKKAA